ncbi:hypothetical protein MNBD_GAMMA26-1451 [hydrothermal vent metagenome]|uniref:Outer membrane efflux protein n=1 Tax=hydrothermal vent metagenome TaxID=652676 RepID=A0A3B1BHC7_9ZZZZ
MKKTILIRRLNTITIVMLIGLLGGCLKQYRWDDIHETDERTRPVPTISIKDYLPDELEQVQWSRLEIEQGLDLDRKKGSALAENDGAQADYDQAEKAEDQSTNTSTPPSIFDLELARTLASYHKNASELAENKGVYRTAVRNRMQKPGTLPARFAPDPMPTNFSPWWRNQVISQANPDSVPVKRSLEEFYLSAIENSTQIKVFKDIPLIRGTAILEAEGRFDPHLFMEARFEHTNEPVGSTLKTGGPSRFREHDRNFTFGVRKKTTTGAEVELSQRVGAVKNNSVFFLPDPQSQSKLNLSITQPLLNRSGVEYNRSTVRIAKLDHQIALDEFQRQMESHMLELARSYWGLYLERAVLIIKSKLVEETELLLDELNARRKVDVLESQLVRTRAALTARRSDTIRAGQAVRNAEAKLISLVNDPDVRMVDTLEIVPDSPPATDSRTISLREAAEHALHNRPEINQTLKQLQAGMIRLNMSKKELLPVLDLVLGASLDGLNSGTAMGDAVDRQFDEGGPSYYAGVIIDIPLGNQTAKARHQRRRLEVRQLTNQLRTTVETLLLEVQVSVREVNTARQQVEADYQSMTAAKHELESISERGILSSDEGRLRGILLEDLLSAQERLTEKEQMFLVSLVTYNVSLTNLDRSMGVLLQTQEINMERSDGEHRLPEMIRTEFSGNNS